MTAGHLTIAFDYKRPTATFVWLDTGETVKVTYVATVDRVMHLATADQRRIKLPLGETVELVLGVRMKLRPSERWGSFSLQATPCRMGKRGKPSAVVSHCGAVLRGGCQAGA
jgi:hypothetical protein